MAAQIYILPFLSDNQLIVKKVNPAPPGAPVNSLELIQVAITPGNINKDNVARTLLNDVGITLDASDKDRINFCTTAGGAGAAPNSQYAIIKINKNPNNNGSVFNIGANKNYIDSYGLIFNPANENLLQNVIDCRNAATAVPPAPTPSPKKFRLIRFLPPFFFPPPFIGPPILSPFAPYGNAVIRTPVGSPFFRLPGLSLPPDFVPAVIPTVRQPMLSPFGNPFPTRVREPSPVYKNLFEEKSRPAHFRSPRFKMDGGYYSKYLKYKNKYLELKNQLENQV